MMSLATTDDYLEEEEYEYSNIVDTSPLELMKMVNKQVNLISNGSLIQFTQIIF